jgi:pimeloyl-ACP methyl ester carboxylesterase
MKKRVLVIVGITFGFLVLRLVDPRLVTSMIPEVQLFQDFDSATLVICGIIFGFLALRLVAPVLVTSRIPEVQLVQGSDSRTLVVVLHGFGGKSRPGLIRLACTSFPNSHLIAPKYNGGPFASFSNRSPYDIADIIEVAVNDAHLKHQYDRIVLIGHSMGGEVLRKVYLWGTGNEVDRPARRGAHAWVNRVERFVSLAAINRGWSTDPAPANMAWYRKLEFDFGLFIAKLTGTGKMIMSMQRGAPFVADSRVQWIEAARQNTGLKLPLLIHLLGTKDDIASMGDIKDVQVAKDFHFKSLPNTGHADIATALTDEIGADGPLTWRARTILDCVTLPLEQLSFDKTDGLIEDLSVRRIVFILHGIRDYDAWGMKLKDTIDEDLPSDTKVLLPKYGYFPMAPFLLWQDRQEKVRWFMDYYTEVRAQYPHAEQFDFIGHSNGTYILSSALQNYQALKINDVYFAGSVVPQRYPWNELVRHNRVSKVRNVVATNDWVVAYFPRFFEQIAEWKGANGKLGALDLGAAGFRGFQESGGPSEVVKNIAFATGKHSVGVDIEDEDKLQALIRFGRVGLDSEQEYLFKKAFKDADNPDSFIDIVSNVSWLVWLSLATGLIGIAAGIWRWEPYAVAPYALLVMGILYSV